MPPQIHNVDTQAAEQANAMQEPTPAQLEPTAETPVDSERPRRATTQPIQYGYNKYNNAMLGGAPPLRRSPYSKPTRSKALEYLLGKEIQSTREKLALVTVQETEDGLTENQWAAVVHYTMTQYSFKTALKKFPGRAEKAIGKELLQVHTRETFEPRHASKLTPEQKLAALEAIMTVKHKRNDSVKGRNNKEHCQRRRWHLPQYIWTRCL